MARVLIHSLIFSPDGVSTAYLYTDLAIELKKLGHEVTVLTTTPHFNVDCEQQKKQPLTRKSRWLFWSERDGIPIWHISIPPKTSDSGARMRHMLIFHLRALWFGLCRAGKYDVILSPSPPLTIGAVSWLLAKRWRAKPVYNVQELYPDFAINQGVIKNPWVIRILRSLESFVYAKNERVITIGDKFRKAIISRGVPARKVLTIPNFVDVDLYHPMPKNNSFARQHGLVNRFIVMYAGNIGLAQYWDPMLEAASRTKAEILYVVIGGGSKKNWLAEEIRGRKLENILLLDYQPREKMAEINASCDVATIIMEPRVEDDGFPSKIYTTMACARPSVICCSENSELVRIVRESKCGIWARPGQTADYVDALLAYRNDPNRIAVEGSAGRAFVQARYSRQVVSRLYHEMIQDLLN
jgi:glycosyltransferase involved in cell wall biosynthesis